MNNHHRHHSTGGFFYSQRKTNSLVLLQLFVLLLLRVVGFGQQRIRRLRVNPRRDETRRMMGRRREERKTGLRRVIHEEIHFSLVQRMPLRICEFFGIKGTNSREQKIHRNFVCLTHTARHRRLLRIILSLPSLSLENAGSLKECHGQRRRSSRECQCTGLHEVSGSVDSKESECPMRSTPS